MQNNYTAQSLFSELTAQGVILQISTDGNLFLGGEMSDAQFFAVKELKPKLIDLINENKVCRFGSNQDLFFNLDAAAQVFDSENKSANLFFLALLKHAERCAATGKEMLCFCQPDESAYKSELRLCAALQSQSEGNVQSAFNNYIETHTLGIQLGDWVQDLPLWRVRIFEGEKEIEFAVCNAVQSAILTGFYSAKNPDVTHQITRA